MAGSIIGTTSYEEKASGVVSRMLSLYEGGNLTDKQRQLLLSAEHLIECALDLVEVCEDISNGVEHASIIGDLEEQDELECALDDLSYFDEDDDTIGDTDGDKY